jgi:predicted transcriptional regulator
MSGPLITLEAVDSVATALASAKEHGVHHFPICARERLLGVVCTCDLQEARPDRAVGELMRRAVTIPLNRSSTDAAVLMRTADVGSVLVVDAEGRAHGIVTRGDLDEQTSAQRILADVRCECCATSRHLHRYDGRLLCVSCRERASEPQAFETGGGD